MSENRLKIDDFTLTRSLWPKISGKRTFHTNLFTQLGQWMCYNFVADTYHTKKNFCSRLSSS